MASEAPDHPQDLTGSSMTIRSDSENYSSGNNELSPSPPSSSSSPMILYSPPTIWGLLRGAAINLLLPFVNGLMLGFGELLAHEAAFRLGWSGTKFSSRIATAPLRSTPGAHIYLKPLSPWRPLKCSGKPLKQAPFSRLASTTSDPLPVANPQPVAFPQDDFYSTLDNLSNSKFTPVTEHIGYLKELGLDYGWGPTAFVQTLLEHVHVWTGIPWAGSIILTAVLVRMAMLKAYVNASDTSARMAVITPLIKPIQDRITAARTARDQQAMMAASAEIQGVYRSANVQIWRLAIPMLQVPLGFGTFRLMRGMASLPVPGMDTQGLLWLQDLTIPDPYFLLPVITAAAFHLTFKRGGEMGTTTPMAPVMKNIFVYIFPGMTGIFMLFWPGCLQVTFFTTAMLSLSQSWILRQPWMRQYLGIQPLPPPPTKTPPRGPYTGILNTYQPPAKTVPLPEKKGIIGGAMSDLKGAAGQAMKSAKGMVSSDTAQKKVTGRSPEELRRARAYEEKRRREIAQERFEKAQRKWTSRE